MNTVRDITFPIQLTPAQLSYLLALIEAKNLIGVKGDLLFPDDEQKKDALWTEGRRQLEENKWLVKKADESERYDLNSQLMLIIAVMADPEIVILSTWGAPQEPRLGVTHYLSDGMVVEQAYDDSIFQIAALSSLDVALKRLANSMDVPNHASQKLSFRITREEAKHAKDQPNAAWLIAQGLSSKTAELFAETLQHPRLSGAIRIESATMGRPSASDYLGVLSSEEISWLARPADDDYVDYKTTDSPSFQKDLADVILALRTQSHA